MLFIALLFISTECFVDETEKVNIVTMGKVFSGKHLLINELFHEEFIPSNVGKDPTNDTQVFSKKGYPMLIYNTLGIDSEGKRSNYIKNQVIDLVNKQAKTEDPKKFIHCILYCVKCNIYKLDEKENSFIMALLDDPNLKDIPIIITIIQNDNNGKRKILYKNIKKLNLNIFDVVPVIVKKKVLFFPGYMNYGLGQLTNTIMKSTSMIHVDNSSSLVYKRAASSVVIASATLSASYVGYKSTKISKFYLFAPIEIGMIKSIQMIYGIKAPDNFIDKIVDEAINNFANEVKALVLKKISQKFSSKFSNTEKNETSSKFSWADKIFKFLNNGPIAAATSGIVTASLGGVYVNIMEKAYNGKVNFDMNNEETIKFVKPMLIDHLHTSKLLEKYAICA